MTLETAERLIPWSSILLVALWVLGLVLSETPLRWFRQEDKALKDVSEEPPDGLDPTPIRERRQMLERMKGTALLEGDVGAFILRQKRVHGEGIAGFMATVLVTLSILFTVVGMSFTVANVAHAIDKAQPPGSTAPPSGSPASAQPASPSPADTRESKAVAVALGAMPFLFIPTAVGLLLAVLLLWRQAVINKNLESVWHRIDNFTEEVLIPKHIPKQPDPSAEMGKAAQALSQASEKLNDVSSTVHATMGELKKLDQSRWAQELIQAAHVFQEKAGAAGSLLDAAATKVSDAFQQFPGVSAEMQKLCGAFMGASHSVQQSVESAKISSEAAASVIGRIESSVLTLKEGHEQFTQRLLEGHKSVATSITGLTASTQVSVDNLTKATNDRIGELNKAVGTLGTAVGAEVENLQTSVNALSSTVSSSAQNQSRITATIEKTVEALRLVATTLPDKIDILVKQGRESGVAVARELNTIGEDTRAVTVEMQRYLNDLQKLLEKTKGELDRVLHEAHQTLLTEILNRLDQGHELHEHLARLTRSMGDIREPMATLGTNLTGIASFVPPVRQDLAHVHATLSATGESMRDFAMFLRTSVAESNGHSQSITSGLAAWQQALAVLAQVTAELRTAAERLARPQQESPVAADPAIGRLVESLAALTQQFEQERADRNRSWWSRNFRNRG